MNTVRAEFHQAHVQRRMRMSATPRRLKAKDWAPSIADKIIAKPRCIWIVKPQSTGPQADQHVHDYDADRNQDRSHHVRCYLLYRLGLSEPDPQNREPSIRQVIAAVSRVTGISDIDIRSSRRTANVVLPRQVAMYLARLLTTKSLPEIGRRMGGRDHTTCLHAYRKIDRLQHDPEVSRLIRAVRVEIEVLLPVTSSQAPAGEP